MRPLWVKSFWSFQLLVLKFWKNVCPMALSMPVTIAPISGKRNSPFLIFSI